jgi:hypothetical protein
MLQLQITAFSSHGDLVNVSRLGEELRCRRFVGFRVRTCGMTVVPDLDHLPIPAGWQPALREATAPLSDNVSQMSGDEAKIKPASTQFFIPANQQARI